MSNLLYLVVAVGLSVIGSLILWYRHRKPTSMEHGIQAFNNELRALAPEQRASRRDRRPG
jgi:hypothetical protein